LAGASVGSFFEILFQEIRKTDNVDPKGRDNCHRLVRQNDRFDQNRERHSKMGYDGKAKAATEVTVFGPFQHDVLTGISIRMFRCRLD
jgi:hypothetical protein